MEKAEVMISSFAAAGFSKLHLDCSMGCQGEPVTLKDEETASRAARLAAAAESALPGGDAPKPVYVIGTEVPIPGGAMHALDELELTTPEDALRTVEVHETAFAQAGQSDAFTRVIAAVVQPGVEFGSHNVVDYNSSKAEALSATLKDMPGLVFEAHSTDYQTRANLTDLVRDGFAILKVGPGLTFVLREALYGLDAIAEELFPPGGTRLCARPWSGSCWPHRRTGPSTTTAVLPSWPCSGISRTAIAFATTGHSRRLTRPWHGYSRFWKTQSCQRP